MNLIEKATIINYHRKRIDAYSDGTLGALGWRGPDSQLKRFEALREIGDLSGCSILDIGCGYGDLKGYLDGWFSNFTYMGIDQMPEFIAVAKERYRDCPNTFFSQTDFTVAELPNVDYVFASGALGYRCDDPEFYGDMIRKMYQAAGQAAAFNMLDVHVFPAHPLLIGHDCDNVAAFCRTLTRRVEVRRGYLVDDFTVFMRRS